MHPEQIQAFEKLKRLKVGALYIDRQDGKLRTVLELVAYRLESGRIDGVLWLCTGRKADMIWEGICRHAPDISQCIKVQSAEALSFSLNLFGQLMREAQSQRTMLVIDNGLLIKNVQALRTQRVLALSARCPYRLLVSDVPFTLSVADMYAPWRALDWRILGYSSYWGFAINHLGAGNKGRNVDYLTRAIEPYCAQVLREEVQATGEREEFVWQFKLTAAGRAEYAGVVDRFVHSAFYTRTGVYRMLHACQAVTSGRRVLNDYPLVTDDMYERPDDNPRIQALLDVVRALPARRMLILCRYRQECAELNAVLAQNYGERAVLCYPCACADDVAQARFIVMNVFTDEREYARLRADAVVYYSCDWNWRKRSEKERQCLGGLDGGKLTVVSLAAADTIDMSILKCIWGKDNMVRYIQEELHVMGRRGTEERYAKDI